MAFNPDDEATIKSLAYVEALRAAELVYKQHQEAGSMTEEQPRGESESEEELQSAKAWAVNMKGIVDAWQANLKRAYDEYQDLGLVNARNARTHFDKAISDAQQYDNQRQVIANQALQNAVETANMTGKQAVKHADIAADGLWNPIQQGAADTMTVRAVSLDDASLKAIGAMVAAALAEAGFAQKSLNR